MGKKILYDENFDPDPKLLLRKRAASSGKNTRSISTRSTRDISVFNPKSEELQLTWHSFAQTIFCVNAYPNGITVSVHRGVFGSKDMEFDEEGASETLVRDEHLQGQYLPTDFHLRFSDTRDYRQPAGKYYLYKDNYVSELERHLSLAHHQNRLSNSVIYFGTTTDPFFSFQKKFQVTINCLQLFEVYQPARVVIQTRSPMAIAALPTLKLLGDKAVVAMTVESRLEETIARYTPGQAKIAQRLVAMDGLRKQGIQVQAVVSPVLPFGHLDRHTWEFAEMLNNHADYISLGGLATGDAADEPQLKHLAVAKKLIADGQLEFLRPHSFRELYQALRIVAPEKLKLPVEAPLTPSQLSLFAA